MPDYRAQSTHVPQELPGGAPRIAYSPEALASLLCVSRRTVYRLVDAGELPSLRIGASLRIPHAAVVAYVERRLAAAAGAK